MLQAPTIYYLSEQAVTLQFGHEISEEVWNRVRAFNRLLQSKPFTGLGTTVPAYTTLSVFYDPVQVLQAPELPGTGGFEKVSAYLMRLTHEQPGKAMAKGSKATIPVCYGSDFGPDLDEVALLHQLSTKEVIKLHSSVTYKVYMTGFVPGFAYLGGMDARLTTPRKATPRKAIPAGSVGIAGGQTGVYPLQTPGGWQLIGRTPLMLFNAAREQPALLQAGDEVEFKPISADEYEHYLHQPHAD